MSVTLVSKGSSVRDQVSAEEWQARVELAAGHRVLAYYGVNDMTYNHFGLRVPGDPEARRDIPKDAFGSISTTAFEHQQLFATADECLAWFNLISTAVQLIMIGIGAAKGVLKGAAAVAGDTLGPYLKWTSNKLDVIDILTTMINGAVHASEMTTSLIMGYAVAEHGTASVKALT